MCTILWRTKDFNLNVAEYSYTCNFICIPMLSFSAQILIKFFLRIIYQPPVCQVLRSLTLSANDESKTSKWRYLRHYSSVQVDAVLSSQPSSSRNVKV